MMKSKTVSELLGIALVVLTCVSSAHADRVDSRMRSSITDRMVHMHRADRAIPRQGSHAVSRATAREHTVSIQNMHPNKSRMERVLNRREIAQRQANEKSASAGTRAQLSQQKSQGRAVVKHAHKIAVARRH